MPRVSADHVLARRQQIVEAALRCFAKDGFHATSMRDVVRESELSAGAVYSYFPSKESLIAAAVAPVLDTLTDALDDIAKEPDRSPSEVVGELLERIYPVAVAGDFDYPRIVVTAWGEALRDPAVRGAVEPTYRAVRGRLVENIIRWRDAGHLPAETNAEALGQVLLSTLAGFVLQHALLGDVELGRYVTALSLLMPHHKAAQAP
jgi:AcrR family transcriptional regulator